MKLIFEKDAEKNLQVKIRDGLAEKEFSYIDMIKSLRDNNVFDASEFDANITEDEQDRVNSMLLKINEVITEKETDE